MEATLSTADNTPLIGPLALNLDDARAPYIISNTQTTSFCPQNIVTHNGTNVLELNFRQATSGWMVVHWSSHLTLKTQTPFTR